MTLLTELSENCGLEPREGVSCQSVGNLFILDYDLIILSSPPV